MLREMKEHYEFQRDIGKAIIFRSLNADGDAAAERVQAKCDICQLSPLAPQAELPRLTIDGPTVTCGPVRRSESWSCPSGIEAALCENRRTYEDTPE